ncbi:type 1 glutamine amidotransferase domain-containing protein [Halobacteriaceae archaeon GCM10025711]
MTDALFVVSEEGYWGEECIEPLTTLDDAGVNVTVATPTGGPPVVDERSLDPDRVGEEKAEWLREVDETDERLNDPEMLSRVDADDYDAVVFPGGHGTEWDINQDKHARQVLVDVLEREDGGKAMIVCHATGILAFARNGDGVPVGKDRDVTGFPNAWEENIVDEDDIMPDGRKLPYWVEDEVTAVGGNFDPELDKDESVKVDGDLVTGRGPGSSHAAATTLLDELGVER